MPLQQPRAQVVAHESHLHKPVGVVGCGYFQLCGLIKVSMYVCVAQRCRSVVTLFVVPNSLGLAHSRCCVVYVWGD